MWSCYHSERRWRVQEEFSSFTFQCQSFFFFYSRFCFECHIYNTTVQALQLHRFLPRAPVSSKEMQIRSAANSNLLIGVNVRSNTYSSECKLCHRLTTWTWRVMKTWCTSKFKFKNLLRLPASIFHSVEKSDPQWEPDGILTVWVCSAALWLHHCNDSWASCLSEHARLPSFLAIVCLKST